jgi:hypothetical protein
MIKYVTDSNLFVGSRLVSRSQTRTPTHLSAGPKADPKRFRAPALSASVTHTHGADPQPDPKDTPLPLIEIPDEYRQKAGAAAEQAVELQAAPTGSRWRSRRNLIMAVAFGLTFVLTAWNVALLIGAGPRSGSTNPDPPPQEPAGERRAASNSNTP